jgi:hypothetical protein
LNARHGGWELNLDQTLTSFIWVWLTLILLLNIFGIVGLFMSADSGEQALHQVQEIYSPLNVMNWLLELLILSPALIAYVWRARRRKSLQSR